MSPWLECSTLNFDLATPARGRYRDMPEALLAKGRRLLEAVLKEAPPRARLLAHLVRWRTRNRFHREIAALAARAGVDWRDLTLANISYDLRLAQLGCSTLALPTADGPVLARNMDWWPQELLAACSIACRYRRGGKLVFASAGWPGAVGVATGVSGRGFAVALNAVLGPEKPTATGYPVLLHLRRVLEDARDFHAALRVLSEPRLAAAGLFTLVGVENDQRVVIERSPRRCAHRWGETDQPLVCTNHYRLLFRDQLPEKVLPSDPNLGELDETSCDRYTALCEFFRHHRPREHADDASLLYVLSEPDVVQDITAQHVVMRPRTGDLRLYVPRRLVQTHVTSHALES